MWLRNFLNRFGLKIAKLRWQHLQEQVIQSTMITMATQMRRTKPLSNELDLATWLAWEPLNSVGWQQSRRIARSLLMQRAIQLAETPRINI